MPRSHPIAFRRGTAAQWAAANPVLANGEPGFETDTGVLRIGNGVTAWTALLAHGTAGADLVWEQCGTTGLTRLVMTQDASNSFTADISDRYLRFTGTGAGGNHREAWVLPGTVSANSELTSLLGPSNTLGISDAQWGHLHRVQQISLGVWRAFAVWTDSTIPIPTLLNFGVVEFNGSGSMSINNVGQNGVPEALTLLRYCPIHRAQRAGNVVTAHTSVPWLPLIGDSGGLSVMAAAGFNIGSATVTDVDRNLRTFKYAQVAADATDADAGGTWAPTTVSATIPFVLSSRLIGNTLYAAAWRREEAPVDWSHPYRVWSFTIVGGVPAPPVGEGSCALWVAHLASPNALRFGDAFWRSLL